MNSNHLTNDIPLCVFPLFSQLFKNSNKVFKLQFSDVTIDYVLTILNIVLLCQGVQYPVPDLHIQQDLPLNVGRLRTRKPPVRMASQLVEIKFSSTTKRHPQTGLPADKFLVSELTTAASGISITTQDRRMASLVKMPNKIW